VSIITKGQLKLMSNSISLSSFICRLICGVFITLSLIFQSELSIAGNILLTETEKQWIKDNPVITVGNELDWPPFDFVVDGKPAGFSIDLMRLVKQKTGLDVRFVNGYNWSQLLLMFKAGKIDVMPAIYSSEERKQYALFTRSYYSQPSVMVVHKDNTDILDVNSLKGKKVAVIRGFVITSVLKQTISEIELLEVENIVEGLKTVSVKEADAFIDSIGTVSYHLEHHYVPDLKVISRLKNKDLASPALHLATSKNEPVLRSILDKVLASISRIERMSLEKRWIHVPESISTLDASKRIVLTAEQIEWLSEHPVIRVGVDKDYAPYSYQDNDHSYIGIAPDFLKLLGEKIGITFELLPDLSWSEILQGTKDDLVDVVATAVMTDHRKQFLNFTQIYIPTPLVIMTEEGNSQIQAASDLNGRTVALVKDYSTTRLVMNQYPAVKQLLVETPVEGLHAVSSGAADAYVGVIGVNLYEAQKKGITNLKIAADFDVLENGQRLAVRSNWHEFALILDRALDSITEDERKAIYNKWISVPHIEQVDYSLLFKLLAGFLLIIGLLYWHNRKLSREISRRQRVETKLTVLNQKLEKEKAEADSANISKSHFLSSMGHELRTPLNAIMGFSQLLSLDNVDKFQAKDMSQEITKAGDYLLNVINGILDLSKIEAGKVQLDIESSNLYLLVNECVSLVKHTAQKRSIEIEISIEETGMDLNVRVDAMRYKQVLINLLSNAIKYNMDGGKVSIGYRLKDDRNVLLEVKDTGKGLTEVQKEHLFKPFERAGAENTSIEGTGLGLAICKQLIEMMDGEIGFESELGKGSCFWILVPLS